MRKVHFKIFPGIEQYPCINCGEPPFISFGVRVIDKGAEDTYSYASYCKRCFSLVMEDLRGKQVKIAARAENHSTCYDC